MNILIVEPEGPLRRAIKSLVADLADEVFERQTATEGLAAYAQHRPDWALLGSGLGEQKALALVRQLNAVWPNARIAVVVGEDEQEFREAARHAGACAFVAKENLIELRRVLSA